MNTRSSRRGAMRTAIAMLALVLLAALAMPGCAETRSERVDAAADYVRCSLQADYEDMAKVVVDDAKPYCYALAAAPRPSEPLAKIIDEIWEEDALIFEVSFGGEEAYTYIRVSPPTDEAPEDVVVETWNKIGDESNGTLTVTDNGGDFVVSHVDGEPIQEVLAVGSGGL